MTRRLFVCHANADIEATSEVVDALESALNFPPDALWTSGLPGYSTEPSDMAALGSALAGSDVVLALVTEASVRDPHFHFQLGAAWALGAHTVLFLLDPEVQSQLPLALASTSTLSTMYRNEPEQWTALIGELSVRLGLMPRPATSSAPSIAPSHPAQRTPSDSAEAASPAAAPLDSSAGAGETPAVTPTAASVAGAPPTAAAAPQRSYLDELRAIAEAESSPDDERTAPRHSYIDDLRELDEEPEASELDDAELEPSTGEQPRVPPDAVQDEIVTTPSQPTLDSDVFARLPTCEMALEAGRAVSDCVFNRAEIDDFASELDEPLGRLLECLGASWPQLRDEHDLDTWVSVTDQLLQTLPIEVRKVEEWYRVGFELATLHNLAGQLVLDGSDAAAEQHWRGALERFLMRAERAEIGYEDLGRVLGLLENLAGPSHERDLANIPRSLEELRRYAAGADIHTAA